MLSESGSILRAHWDLFWGSKGITGSQLSPSCGRARQHKDGRWSYVCVTRVTWFTGTGVPHQH
ncbi:hypothetical protein EYF80_021894 [Liparis tanakae]|uniref:Uncharacterized protein n=1 Tax=Liparis tanakae TaxID=230148 RepID=A0A4Z2HRI0_9TELE|nr:hypothetical protein EYF80_021894 [Liparis tanakae]